MSETETAGPDDTAEERYSTGKGSGAVTRPSWGAFFTTLLGWLVITVPVAFLLGYTSIESLFVPAFLGLLVLTLVFEPVESSPRWWVAIRLLSHAGFFVLGYFILQRANELGI